MDRNEIKKEVGEALREAGYRLNNDISPDKNGLVKLTNKCTGYAMENPTADIVAYADTLVSEPLYKIIWSCPAPGAPIDRLFNAWLPVNCVKACFIAGDGLHFTLTDSNCPTWDQLPYAHYSTYSLPFNIRIQIKKRAVKDLKDIYKDSLEDSDLCERAVVICYQTLK